MEELKNFFENPRPSNAQLIKLRAPLTDGFRITKENPMNQLGRREDHRHSMLLSGTDYAREVKQKENELYMQNEMDREKYQSISGGLESLEHLSSFGASLPNIRELTEEAMTEVYSKYSFQRKEDVNSLPITEYKQKVVDRINCYPVVIIQGPTGCGKTTQVPQWILDDCYQRRRPCKIIVTQPRRIAAISIARRVAQERGWDVGGLVGFQVGLENRTSTDTRISYVTTGVLLQKLVGAKNMNEYTHIILDEVHERGQEMDFLLLVVKKLLYTVSPRVKIVLMSATFDSQSFAEYFKTPSPQGSTVCSIIQIQKKEHFTVKNFFLDNLTKFDTVTKVMASMAKQEPGVVPEMHHLVVKLINAFEQIDATEDHIESRDTADLPSVLVFLPGINEIEDLYLCLNNHELRSIGALKKTSENGWSASDGELTYLGRVMAKLPLDVKASKLIMLGHIYGCLEESIVMAAAMSVKNVFSSPFRERLNAYNSKLTWADGSTSDCIALFNVYKVWTHLRQQHHFQQSSNSEAQWARRFYVQVRSLKELDDLVRELKHRLSREGIEINKSPSPWDKNENAIMLKVYLKNFPDHQPGELYAAVIKKAVRQHINDEPRVTFDHNSKKVFLSFESSSRRESGTTNDPTIPGQVVLPVYKAIKARQLKMDIRIPLLPVEKANAMAATLELEKLDINMKKLVPRLPDIDDTHFPLKISEKINVGKFWVQYDDESTASELRQIQQALNRAPLLAYTGPVTPGLVLAGPYLDSHGTTMHRVRVLRTLPRDMVEVIFMDYGNVTRLNACSLYELPAGVCEDTPPLAMQCGLAGVAPSPLLSQHAQWSVPADRFFNKLIAKGPLLGKVYSVTHGVVSIELLADNGRVSVNEQLLNTGPKGPRTPENDQMFAVPCEESYDSKLNHDLRQTATELNMSQKRAFNREQQEMAFYTLRDVDPPNVNECDSDVLLKGPFSPLETVVHNLMYASRERAVTIEWNSVNSVLLDTEPQETYQRMLVAAEVGQNEMSSKLTLRHTTLMPNIPGLPAIMALLFCPVAELRRDSEGTRYVSALCGLGSTEDGRPYFPEHDLLIDIDADLEVNEIGEINHIRYLMDYMMACTQEGDIESASDARTQITSLIRKGIMVLLCKKRTHREPEAVPNAWEWRSVPEHELLDITVPDMVALAVVYQLHTPQELRPLSRDKLLALKKENDQLKLLVARSVISSAADLSCKLCNVGPMPTHAMRIHLYSNTHRDREADFHIFDS